MDWYKIQKEQDKEKSCAQLEELCGRNLLGKVAVI